MFASYQLPPKSDQARAFPAKQAEFEVRIEEDTAGFSSYRPQDGLGWQQHDDDARSTSNSFLGAPAVSDAGSRPDSVFDAYADMYAYSEGDSPAADGAPSPSPELDSEPEPEPARPWDERGKTGLYGGGGRGADDRETGWVRNFEPDEDKRGKRDSRFRIDEEERRASGGRGQGSPGSDHYTGGGRGSSSTDGLGSGQSSLGPVTPNSAQFPRGQGPYVAEHSAGSSKAANGGTGYQSQPVRPLGHGRAPSHASHTSHASRLSYHDRPGPTHQRQPSSANRPQHAPPVLGSMAVAEPVGSGVLAARPMQQVDPSKLKLKRAGGNPAPPPAPAASAATVIPRTATRPLNPPPIPTQAMADLALGNTAGEVKRPKAGFKFGRAKKGIQISAPILPEGFVQSLGMETFALTPGCSAPAHALAAANIVDRPPSRTEPRMHDYSNVNDGGNVRDSQATARPLSVKSLTKSREPGPRPKQVPSRPVQYRNSGQGISIPASSGSNSPAASSHRRPSLLGPGLSFTSSGHSPGLSPGPGPEPVRTPLDALRGVDDRATYFQQDAFRRLSRDSVASYAPSSATLVQDAKTSRRYFDGLREERARQATEESHANSRPAMPPLPRAHAPREEDRESDRGSFQGTAIQSKGGEMFNNPFGGSSGGSQGAPSVRRQSTFSTMSLGMGGAGRAHALSQHRPSISSLRTMSKPPSVGYGRPQERQPVSDDDAEDDIDEDAYRSLPAADDHRGSASSAYSDASELAPPANDFHPHNGFSQGYTPAAITQPLRKNSFKLQQHQAQGPPAGPGRRPSHAYASAAQPPHRFVESSPSVGGDVVWGSGIKSPAGQSYSSPKSGDEGLESLGGSGFRNPFAAQASGQQTQGGWQPGWQ